MTLYPPNKTESNASPRRLYTCMTVWWLYTTVSMCEVFRVFRTSVDVLFAVRWPAERLSYVSALTSVTLQLSKILECWCQRLGPTDHWRRRLGERRRATPPYSDRPTAAVSVCHRPQPASVLDSTRGVQIQRLYWRRTRFRRRLTSRELIFKLPPITIRWTALVNTWRKSLRQH